VPTTGDPTDELILALLRTARLSRTWEAVAGRGMSKIQVSILELLRDRGTCRLTTLADVMRVELSVMSRQVNVLAEAGAIERDRDPDDGRAWLIAITGVGLETLAAVEHGRREWFDQALAGLSQSERATAARVVSAINTEWERDLRRKTQRIVPLEAAVES